MPRTPKEERRHTDVIGHAAKIMRTATGEEPENYRTSRESEGKNPAAVALGRRGGEARAKGLSKKRRREIARKAARVRWARAN